MATSSKATNPLEATCHCGAVTIQTPDKPSEINECQCTLCRRYGVAWAYYDPETVVISVKEASPTRKYVWGDKTLEFHFCSVCGCVMYWKSIGENDEMGINSRMMDPDEIRHVNRKIDWDQLSIPLTSKETAHADDKAQY